MMPRQALAVSTVVIWLCVALSAFAIKQNAGPSHVILIPMANMSQPADVDFQGGACDIERTGETMRCAFQQVLLSPAPDDPTTCSITTNRYEQVFQKQDVRRWVSNVGPDGVCGVVVVTTLQQAEGGLPGIWQTSMNNQKIVTNKAASPLCNALTTTPEVLSWNYQRRALPCKFVKGGSLGI
jgi:hypothetical protein